MSKKALRASRMDLAQNALSAGTTAAGGSADAPRTPLGTRRRALLGGSAWRSGRS